MGCGLTREEKPKKIIGDLKVIILGISGSGKTTFAKQMKIIYNSGFDESEVEYWRTVLTRNVIIGMRDLVKLSQKFDIPIEEENVKTAEIIDGYSYEEPLTDANKDYIRTLWGDNGIQEIWKRCNSFQIQMTQYEYLMEHIDRIAAPDFLPTEEDILRARQKTTGAYTTEFVVDQYNWHLIDVGGQVPERAKWEKIMEDGVQSMLFFSPLDDYNVVSSEEVDQVKMPISHGIFKRIVRTAQKFESPITIFFNKVDLFEKKIADNDLFNEFKRTFPDYEGEQNWEECAEHIWKYFIGGVKEYVECDNPVRIFHHNTCAVDTDSMKTV